MKLKQLICIAATIGISSHAFAMEIYKGKIISEKVWSNDGSKAVINTHKKPQVRHEQGSYEEVMSSISSDEGKVNEPVTMNNIHNFYIYNNTDATKSYMVGESVCSQTSDNFNRCIHYQEQIELEPQGYIYASQQPQLEMTYTKPGRYRVSTMTTLYDGPVPHMSRNIATVVIS